MAPAPQIWQFSVFFSSSTWLLIEYLWVFDWSDKMTSEYNNLYVINDIDKHEKNCVSQSYSVLQSLSKKGWRTNYFQFWLSLMFLLAPFWGQSVNFTQKRKVCLAVVMSMRGQLHKENSNTWLSVQLQGFDWYELFSWCPIPWYQELAFFHHSVSNSDLILCCTR